MNSALYFTQPTYELHGHFPTPQLQGPEKADERCQGNTCPHSINTGERASSISGTELERVFVRTAPKHHSSLIAQGSLREAKPSQRSLSHSHNRLPPGHSHQTEVRSPGCAVQIARETQAPDWSSTVGCRTALPGLTQPIQSCFLFPKCHGFNCLESKRNHPNCMVP